MDASQFHSEFVSQFDTAAQTVPARPGAAQRVADAAAAARRDLESSEMHDDAADAAPPKAKRPRSRAAPKPKPAEGEAAPAVVVDADAPAAPPKAKRARPAPKPKNAAAAAEPAPPAAAPAETAPAEVRAGAGVDLRLAVLSAQMETVQSQLHALFKIAAQTAEAVAGRT